MGFEAADTAIKAPKNATHSDETDITSTIVVLRLSVCCLIAHTWAAFVELSTSDKFIKGNCSIALALSQLAVR